MPAYLIMSRATTASKAPCCAVCMEPCDSRATALTHTPCAHTFHSTCLAAWARRSATCPICRTDLGAARMHAPQMATLTTGTSIRDHRTRDEPGGPANSRGQTNIDEELARALDVAINRLDRSQPLPPGEDPRLPLSHGNALLRAETGAYARRPRAAAGTSREHEAARSDAAAPVLHLVVPPSGRTITTATNTSAATAVPSAANAPVRRIVSGQLYRYLRR